MIPPFECQQTIPVLRFTPAYQHTLRRLLDRFEVRWGYSPGPGDPLLFDPTLPYPAPLDPRQDYAALTEELTLAPNSPDVLHAFHRTGYLLIPETLPYITPHQTTRWTAALLEYRRGQRMIQLFLQRILLVQTEAFTAKFGRPPKKGEPLFFDPDTNTLTCLGSPDLPIDRLLAALQSALGYDPYEPEIQAVLDRLTHHTVTATLRRLNQITP